MICPLGYLLSKTHSSMDTKTLVGLFPVNDFLTRILGMRSSHGTTNM